MGTKKTSDATIRSKERYDKVKAIYLKHKDRLTKTQIFVQYASKIASQRILNQVIKDLKPQENVRENATNMELA